jgi:hypothetical protein
MAEVCLYRASYRCEMFRTLRDVAYGRFVDGLNKKLCSLSVQSTFSSKNDSRVTCVYNSCKRIEPKAEISKLWMYPLQVRPEWNTETHDDREMTASAIWPKDDRRVIQNNKSFIFFVPTSHLCEKASAQTEVCIITAAIEQKPDMKIFETFMMEENPWVFQDDQSDLRSFFLFRPSVWESLAFLSNSATYCEGKEVGVCNCQNTSIKSEKLRQEHSGAIAIETNV